MLDHELMLYLPVMQIPKLNISDVSLRATSRMLGSASRTFHCAKGREVSRLQSLATNFQRKAIARNLEVLFVFLGCEIYTRKVKVLSR